MDANNMKILYIDMDGVTVDFEGYICKRRPDIANIPLAGGARSRAYELYCRQNPHTFLELPPIAEAIDNVVFLSQYYDVHFLSTPMFLNPESYTDKRLWLELYFGQTLAKKLVLTHHKNLVVGDYLIDDTTMHGQDKFPGELIQFGSQKFPNWESVMRYLMPKKGV